MTHSLAVVGLGKLGACMAACFGFKGFQVLGFDTNPAVVEAINLGRAPVPEPGLQRAIDQAHERLQATRDPRRLIDEADITFLIVPTPSRPDGHFSDVALRDALATLGAALAGSRKRDHLFVVTSTVSPGTTEGSLVPVLEQTSGRRLNDGFRIAYSPEFIALGTVVRDFLNPDLVLIGEGDRESGSRLAAIQECVCDNRPAVARMSIVSAELAKLSLNAFVTMKISFANMLSNLCEAVPGTDVDAITAALGADRRISPHGLRGGPAYGGPCFPRDNRALLACARSHGYEAQLPRATDDVNQLQVDRLLVAVERALATHERRAVAILGMAYKSGTNVIEESTGVKLAQRLIERAVDVTICDPFAAPNVRQVFGEAVRYARSPAECFETAPVCVLTLPDPEYCEIDASYVRYRPTTVIDCWRQLSSQRLGLDVAYLALGRAQR